MRRVGILGGTFDPPHIGHVILANEVRSALQLDEVRFMPNHTPPHKKKTESISNDERLKMLELSIAGEPYFKLEKIELQSPGPSYTYNTMKQLKEKEPDTEFFFIIGSDMIEYLPKWYRIEELVELVTFVGVKRPSYSSETPYPVILVDTPQIYLSSSMIRDKVKKGKSIKFLVLPAVQQYIEVNSLYES
ncbi:nicotinate-nucleotide adenylyltransferase [Bacillus testis]|uniref:nicotinate-nucleotide adenylyltransferase n=1 Tax=Bacillus testis TaxID=1622072 RepID=UPI00067F2170|nr:nicotinate-nucleotide adenylyltransferase [Bacillus testis]